MKNQLLKINQIDRQLREWQAIKNKYGKPRKGWVKTLRTALSISGEQFAKRLGLTRGRVHQLENAEIESTVTLRTLENAANALGCELIYAIVPKGDSSLEKIIQTRAAQVAKEQVERVAHSMSLEAQSVSSNVLNIEKDKLAKSLIEHLNKKFWADDLDLVKNPKAMDAFKKALAQKVKKKNDEI